MPSLPSRSSSGSPAAAPGNRREALDILVGVNVIGTTTTTSTSAQPSGQNQTIADYFKQNNIQETPTKHDTPGAPTIDLPVPDGWTVIPEGADAPYGGIVSNTPTDPTDPPKVIAVVNKLTGNVDDDKLFAAASGELKNLPEFDGGEGDKAQLGGFPAYEIGGT